MSEQPSRPPRRSLVRRAGGAMLVAFAGIFLSPETYRAIARVQIGVEVEQPGDLARQLSSRGLGLPARTEEPGD